MSYIRKTKDVWNLVWRGEVIDSFDTFEEAKAMRKEYEMAFHENVSIKAERERL